MWLVLKNINLLWFVAKGVKPRASHLRENSLNVTLIWTSQLNENIRKGLFILEGWAFDFCHNLASNFLLLSLEKVYAQSLKISSYIFLLKILILKIQIQNIYIKTFIVLCVFTILIKLILSHYFTDEEYPIFMDYIFLSILEFWVIYAVSRFLLL